MADRSQYISIKKEPLHSANWLIRELFLDSISCRGGCNIYTVNPDIDPSIVGSLFKVPKGILCIQKPSGELPFLFESS